MRSTRAALSWGLSARRVCVSAFALGAALCWSAVVHAQTPAGSDLILRDFRFESGEVLPELRIHYYTMGQLRRDARGVAQNVVMVMHGTTGSGAGFASRTFGGELFGPGQPLDTSSFYVVVPDAIGHGKSSKPSDGLRSRFPKYTYNDMVLAQHALLTSLGVDHVRVMIGTSMGCMHNWVWAERYPTFVDGHVALACAPTEIAGRNRWARKLAIDFIREDPAYAGGEYTTPPLAGLRAAQVIINFQSSSPAMAQRQMPTRAKADSLATSLVRATRSNFDANDLIYALDASRNYDPSGALETIESYVLAINSADDFINPPELGLMEQLLPRVKHARYVLLPASGETRGHGTHSLAALWKGYLTTFLHDLPRISSR
jgi:homoserine O-acetyltransferase/O-succinyltransferase